MSSEDIVPFFMRDFFNIFQVPDNSPLQSLPVKDVGDTHVLNLRISVVFDVKVIYHL
jgi:hypothetical protein